MEKNNPRRQPPETELQAVQDNWVDDYAPKDKADADYFYGKPNEPEAPKSYRKKRRLPVLLIGLIVIIAAAGLAYWIGNKAGTPASQTTKQTQATTTKVSTTTTPTKQYDSTIYGLSVTYPQTWKVTDTASKLTIVSPSIQLPLTQSKSASGRIVVTIQNSQTTIAGYPSAGALAALESQKLSYKQPSAVQRAQTYLSFLSYGTNGALDSLYITGDNGYQRQQTIPLTDIVKGNPLIQVSFANCTSDDCSGTVTPLSLANSAWKQPAISDPVVALLQSIVLN